MTFMDIKLKKISEGYWNKQEGPKDFAYYEIYLEDEKVGDMSVLDHFEENEDNDTCYVERIDIDESYRNKGIGTQVLRYELDEQYGYSTVVAAPDNEDAQRLYERIGEEGYSKYGLDYMDQGYGVYRIW